MLLSANGRAYFGKSIAIEMGGVSRYFSKVSGSGVDLILLKCPFARKFCSENEVFAISCRRRPDYSFNLRLNLLQNDFFRGLSGFPVFLPLLLSCITAIPYDFGHSLCNLHREECANTSENVI